MEKSIELKWIGGSQFVSRAESNHAIVISAGKAGTADGSGTSPMELILQALAGCSAIDVVSILKKKRQKLHQLVIKAEGDRAEKPPRSYTRIHLTYTATGEGLSEKALSDAVRLSKEKYCSVSVMLEKAAEITYSTAIVEAAEN